MAKPTYEELTREVKRLHLEIARTSKFKKVNPTLSDIAQSTSSAPTLDDLFVSIHTSIGQLIDTTNFYIALYDSDQKQLSFSFVVDLEPRQHGCTLDSSGESSLTTRVLETQTALLITKKEILQHRLKTGNKVIHGKTPEIWLGVPLITHQNTIGVMVVQSYDNPERYSQDDMEILGVVAAQIALAIERKQIEDKLYHSVNKFKHIIRDVNGIAIQGYDQYRRVTFWNKASEILYGYTEQEALGQQLENLIIPTPMREDVVSLHQRWIDKDIPIPAGELTLKNNRGENVQVFSSHVMHETPTGKEMFCIDINLQPIKDAEESAIAANAKFSVAMNALDAFVYVADMETYELLFMNSCAENMLDANVGDTCWKSLQNGQDGPCVFCTNNQLLDQYNKPRPPYIWEFQNTKTKRWYQCQDQCIQWPDGRLVRLEIAFDISARKEIERQLQESDTRFRILHDASFNGLCIHADGKILETNQALVQMTGYSQEELRAINVHFLISPAHRETSKENDRKGSSLPYVVQGVRKDGSLYDLQLKGKPIPYQDKTVRVVEFCDISFQKQAERALTTNEQRHKIIFENSPLGMIYFDELGTIIDCNKNFEEMMDAPRESLIGFNTALQSTPAMQLAIKKALAGNAAVYEDLYTSINGGKTTYLRVMFNPVTPGNSPSPVIATLEDITERKRTEDAVRESARRFKTFFSAIQDAVFVHPFDPDGFAPFVEVNDIACIRYGFSRAELLQRSTYDITCQEFNDIESQQNHRKSLLEKRNKVFESIHVTKSGVNFPVEINANIIYQGGKPFILAVVRDISERHHAEQERKRLEAQLQHAQKMESIGRLAGGIAHDFNNMLGVIIGRSELIMESGDNWAPFTEDVLEIHRAATRSADLTRQLLGFARKQTITPQIVDLNDKITEIISILRRLIGEDVDLLWQPQHNLWPVNIDPGQVDQLLTNLCVNSRDALHNRRGQIIINTHNEHVEQRPDQRLEDAYSGDFIVLSVIDNGCGMSEEIMDNVFEPFFTTKEVGKGTGLGLATVYGIAYQNKGFVETTSCQGTGSTFRIYLPSATALPKKEEALPTPIPRQQNGHHRRVVLLVEDEKSILSFTKNVLERLGYTVYDFSDPNKALKMAAGYTGILDILLTDVIMPRMNGRELSEQISKIHPETKCIFMSGYPDDILTNIKNWHKEKHFLQKPYSKADLLATLENLFPIEESLLP